MSIRSSSDLLRDHANRATPLLQCWDVARTRNRARGSTILDEKQAQARFAFDQNRVFCTDALFIRTENTVGARRAQ
jgi:hypothetical protein